MNKYRFSNPTTVVEVRTSPLDKPDAKNPYTIFDCICRPYAQRLGKPRKAYQITAVSPSAAARMAFGFYLNDFFNGKKSE